MGNHHDAFPLTVQVETGSVSESKVFDQKEAVILERFHPQTLATDNAYTAIPGAFAEATRGREHFLPEIFTKKSAFYLWDGELLAYTKRVPPGWRIRRWAKQGVALLTPALKWINGRFAKAYHRFLKLPDIVQHLRNRRTSVEPLFDLIAKVIGTNGKQKQLPVQRLDNVRICLALATLSVQIAMIANSIWGVEYRNISGMASDFQ